MQICDAIHIRARQTPGKTAILEGSHSTTYGELSLQIHKVAAALRKLGVGAGDLVGVNLRESTQHITTKLGIMQAGGAALTLDWRSKPDSIRILEYLPEKTLVLSEPGQNLPGHADVVPLDDDWDRLVAGQRRNTVQHVDADGPALVTLTSGSSGEPKAIVSTHREQYWRYLQMNIYLPGSVSDLYLSAMPLSFSAGNNYIFNYLMSGATVLLHPVMFSISELIETINRLQVTTLFLVPTVVERLVAEASGHGLLLPGVEKLLVGAAPVSTQTKLRCMDTVTPNFYNIYAASGAGWIAIAYPQDVTARPDSAGRCIATSEVQIVDEQDKPLPSGESGRIRCRGETVTRQFYPGFPITDQNETYLDGFYYPGDLGHFDQQGYLYLNGRAATMIIRDGINVFPEQVEKVLINHQNVNEVAVCGIPSREYGEEVVALVVGRNGVSEKDMIGYSRQNLGVHVIPRHFLFVESLPQSHTGKIARAKLPRLARDLLNRILPQGPE